MKNFLTTLVLFLVYTFSWSQIAAVKMDKGKQKAKVKEVIIAFTMHFDIGYTDIGETVLRKYTTTMPDDAIASVNETSKLPLDKQFIWQIPGWPVKYMLENATAERKAAFEKAIADKRIALHAMPFTIETESSDLENLVRSLSFTSAINNKLGLPLPRDAKMSDVPEHSWVLPTLLTQAGVKILHLGCNPGSLAPDVPRLFWWEGPDGSRLLTFYWPEYYGSDVLPPEDWKYKTWMAMISAHENTGPPTAEEVEKVLKEAQEKMPDAKVRIGRMSDFYDAIIKENPNIPTIRGDMPDTWIHGFMSMPREVGRNKKMQRVIYQAEGLHSLNKIWGSPTIDFSQSVNQAMEKMILFDEHTFGLALSHGAGDSFSYGDNFVYNRSQGHYNRAEISWREKAARIEMAERIGSVLDKEAIKTAASSVNVEGGRVVVYNPHPWTRSGDVSLFMSIYKKNKIVTAVKDLRTNELIPVVNKDNLLQFYAKDIPPMGYAAYAPIVNGQKIESQNELTADENNHRIENKFFKIKIDPSRGVLLSCIDKKSGKEMVDAESLYGFGEYMHEYFGTDELKRYYEAYVKPTAHAWADGEMGRPLETYKEKYERTKSKGGRLVYQKTGEEISVTYFGELPSHYPHRFNITYSIRKNSPYVEVTWNIENKQAEANPEAGWIVFPCNVSNPKFHLGRIGGVVDPTQDFVPQTNHDFYFLNTGMAITDGKTGVGLNTPDAPGVSLDRPGLFRFSKIFKPQTPTVFVNLYNNQWGTNFTEWIEGSWSAKMYLWSIDNYTHESGLITPMEETRQPLAGFYFDGKPGPWPITNKGIQLSQKGIVVTSFAPMADGRYRLRLWEMAGNSGACEIELPPIFKSAQLCNLRDQPLPNAAIMIKEGKLKVNYKAYQPITFLLN